MGIRSLNNPELKKKRQSSNHTLLDVAIIGAGFSGLYSLYCLRKKGLSVSVFDGAPGIGGTWWWNRYPGARVDFPRAPFYAYTFSDELVNEWKWWERQPGQTDVLAYLEYVVDKFNLRCDIQLNTWIRSTAFDNKNKWWVMETHNQTQIFTKFIVCAMGTLSVPNKPKFSGIEQFSGECYHTGLWPNQNVSFASKRVGVIGTGSSGIQIIPIIAKTAEHLTVFQRTPQYSIPAGNKPLSESYIKEVRKEWAAYCDKMKKSPFGMPYELPAKSALDDTPEKRQKVYEKFWQDGGLQMLFLSYHDHLTNKTANDFLTDFIRDKIREIVTDPSISKKLIPDYIIGTKRQIIDDGYFETYNRQNVTLVDLRADPISIFTSNSVITQKAEHPLDMLVLATGYDAITGALTKLNPKGLDGINLTKHWRKQFRTYLGLAISGFPNLFMVQGPQSPSVLFNIPLGSELQANWIADCIEFLSDNNFSSITPTSESENAWSTEIDEIVGYTLFKDTDSWYSGANIEGKRKQFLVHLGGQQYFEKLNAVASNGYQEFSLEK